MFVIPGTNVLRVGPEELWRRDTYGSAAEIPPTDRASGGGWSGKTESDSLACMKELLLWTW